jgi:hypothetical protein
VTQGIITTALTLSDSEAKSLVRVKGKQQGLLRRLQGNTTLNDPNASQPFTQEQQRIKQAIAGNEFAFCIKQIVNLDVARLIPSRRNQQTIL